MRRHLLRREAVHLCELHKLITERIDNLYIYLPIPYHILRFCNPIGTPLPQIINYATWLFLALL